jgi:hypothetical protein
MMVAFINDYRETRWDRVDMQVLPIAQPTTTIVSRNGGIRHCWRRGLSISQARVDRILSEAKDSVSRDKR